MNSQYMNQGSSYGEGPPRGGQQYNGTTPGHYPPTSQNPIPTEFAGGPRKTTPNGPQMPPLPPQGDQKIIGAPPSVITQSGQQYPGMNSNPAGLSNTSANSSQMTNAMQSMNIAGQQPVQAHMSHNIRPPGPPQPMNIGPPQPIDIGPLPPKTYQNFGGDPGIQPAISGNYTGAPGSFSSNVAGQQQPGQGYGVPGQSIGAPPPGPLHPAASLPISSSNLQPVGPPLSVPHAPTSSSGPSLSIPQVSQTIGMSSSSQPMYMQQGQQMNAPSGSQSMGMPPPVSMSRPPMSEMKPYSSQAANMPPAPQAMSRHPGPQVPPVTGAQPPTVYGMPPGGTSAGMPPISGQPHHSMSAAPPGAYTTPSGPPSPGTQMPSMPGPPSFPGPRSVTPGAGGGTAMTGQAQQPRRLDPDQMPSPIQVIEDDQRNRSGAFPTGQRGVVPPLVTTNFYSEDQGNSGARYIRSSMYNIPCTSDMLKQSHLPIVLNISPFPRLHPKESAPPLVDLGQLGPVRCNRCKAYMCPYMQFVDGGRRFQCSFCNCSTEVPPEYFAHLDHTGRRLDCYDRPELCLGTYEFVATEDYCKNNVLPKPPAFIFMIDVSYNSVKSGFVNFICSKLKEDVLKYLPREDGATESEIHVGFVTYAKELHFYNVKGSLAQPQMLVVSDVQDVFVPLLSGFFVKLSESESVIDSLLSQIPEMFADCRETEVVLGPVMQAGLDALRSSERTGKLIIFHSSLPIAEAPGKLKNRDDRKLLGTDKEKTLLTPQNTFYSKLGQDCVSAGCSVDLYLFPNSYVDIATVGEVSRLTGGSIYKYMYFQADLDGDRFIDDLRENCMKPIAFDAIMRVRTSTGIRPTDFYGNFYMANTTDVEMASVDSDKSVTVEVKHDDKLSESEGACAQAAVLYTSITGQRRLRIINMSFNCCNQMADLFRNCELDTLLNFMSKLAIRQSLNTSPKSVREELTDQCAHILSCYRKNCASPSAPGQLILPECMKLLPVYCNCLIKSNIMQGGSEVSTDERSFLMQVVNGMPVDQSAVFFYPRLLPLHELDLDTTDIPNAVRCSYERLSDQGVYLLENGLVMFLWIGINVNPTWVQNVFSVQSAAQIDIDRTKLADFDNPLSRRVRSIVKHVREERKTNLKLVIVRQRDKLEPIFQQYLVEDRGANGTASYVDFLCHIHKEIRRLLS